MDFHQLTKQQQNIKNEMLLKLRSDTCMLKQLADEMAECATNIQGQGYVVILQSREKFLSELDRLSVEYTMLIDPE